MGAVRIGSGFVGGGEWKGGMGRGRQWGGMCYVYQQVMEGRGDDDLNGKGVD